jgi:hypothetical protein
MTTKYKHSSGKVPGEINSGTMDFASATNYATGSHGLSVTPATKDFYITAYATEPIDMYLDTIGATYFTVRCAAVVTATRTIGWRVDTS